MFYCWFKKLLPNKSDLLHFYGWNGKHDVMLIWQPRVDDYSVAAGSTLLSWPVCFFDIPTNLVLLWCIRIREQDRGVPKKVPLCIERDHIEYVTLISS